MKKALIFLLIFSFVIIPFETEAKTLRVNNVYDLSISISSLEPGDTLIVEAGEYKVSTLNIKNIAGSPGNPITIKAEGTVTLLGISYDSNVVDMKEVHYLNFEGFSITSQANQNDDIDGINISGEYSSNINFDDLNIHDVSGNGISVFVAQANNINLRNSEISNTTGGALDLGYPGKYIISDSIIEDNYIHHTPKLEIDKTSHAIQVHGGSYGIQILDNILHDVGGLDQSGIAVYYGKTPEKGDLDADKNIVRGNIIYNIRNEGITAGSDALIENNMVLNTKYGINIQTYSDESFGGKNYVENLNIKNNITFNCDEVCLNVSDWGYTGGNVSFVGNEAYQDYVGKNAIGGSTGKAVTKDNIYYGVSTLLTGATKSTRTPDVKEAVSLADILVITDASRMKDAFLGTLDVREEEVVSKEDIEKTSYNESDIMLYADSFPNLNVVKREIYNRIIVKAVGASDRVKNALATFINTGTNSTWVLGAGERAGVVDSYRSVFGHLPEEREDWMDVIKIANGRWPTQRNATAEVKAKEVFRKIYLRSANMNQANDNAAITIITYGLRPSKRNTNSEKVAIKTFEHIYKRSPKEALDWDVVRAIAYSGAKR